MPILTPFLSESTSLQPQRSVKKRRANEAKKRELHEQQGKEKVKWGLKDSPQVSIKPVSFATLSI